MQRTAIATLVLALLVAHNAHAAKVTSYPALPGGLQAGDQLYAVRNGVDYSAVWAAPTFSLSSASGLLGYANGGTGLTTLGSAGQCIVVNQAGTGLAYGACGTGGGSYTNGAGLSLTNGTFAVVYGNVAGTAAQGNDSRLALASTALQPGATIPLANVSGAGSAAAANVTAFLQPANNLSDVASPATARANLGLGSAAGFASTAFAQAANNLSDLASAATARLNLGLGALATQNTVNLANQVSGVLPAANVATLNQNTTGNAATATALAATPSACAAGQYATGISANGTPTCSTPAGGGGGGSGTVTNVSGTAANGASPTFANQTTTPALTIAPTAGGTFASSANNLSFFAATTSAQLAGVISDESGSGSAVFANAPTLVSPIFTGTASAANITTTGVENVASLQLPNSAAHGILIGEAGAGVVSVAPTSGTVNYPLINAGTGSDPAFGPLNLANAVTGVAGINNGGTGANTLAGARTALGISAAAVNYAALNGFGDSFMYGLGGTNPGITGVFALLARDVAAYVINNYGVSGTTVNTITNSVFLNYYSVSALPTLNLIQGGENDRTTCSSATASCGISFTDMYLASDAYISIPQANRIYASNATKNGTWTTITTDTYQPSATTAVGNPASNTTSGNTLTFSVPSSSSTKVGFTYKVLASSTATFTVSVDGSLVTDNCSGTTTFSEQACSPSNPAIPVSAFYRQEYSVAANQTHTVVVTNTSSGAIEPLSVDWIPTGIAANTLFDIGENVDTTWGTNYPVWNAAKTTVTSTLKGDGLPVYFVDVVNGTPGLNATTDTSSTATASCPASTTGSHPNDCGYLHLEQTILNVASANNVTLTQPNIGGRYTFQNGTINNPLTITLPTGYTLTHNQTFSSLGGYTSTPTGIDFYRNGSNVIGGIAQYLDGSTGKPWSNKFMISSYGSGGFFWNCTSASAGNGTATNAASNYTTVACTDQSGNQYLSGADYVPSGLTIGTTYATGSTPISPPAGGAIIQGNVGIGTNAPTATLTLNGPLNYAATGAPASFALTTSGYTVPANAALVRFNQTGTVASATITLPTVTADNYPIEFNNEKAGAITALTFSPAVVGFTNGNSFAANSTIKIRWDAGDSTWNRVQ